MTAPAVVKRLEFWIVLALTVAGAGFGTAMFLNNYATAADVVKIGDRVVDHESRISRQEARTEHIEEDLHWQREQTARIAERVGAEPVPPPKH